jgi:hypothetical protein
MRATLHRLMQAAHARVPALTIGKVSGVIAAAAAAISVFLCVQIIYLAQDNIPLFDEWMYTDDDALLSDLFHLHNEHWLVTGRILIWLDAILFRSSALALKVATLICFFGLAALVTGMARSAGLRGGKLWAAALASIVLIVSPAASQNLTWGFQTCFVISIVAAAGACASISVLAPRRSMAALIGAAVLCIVSAFSLSSGLLVAPLLAIAAALYRRWTTALVLAGVAAGLWVAHALTPGNASVTIIGPGDIPVIAQYFLTFLGSPFGILSDALLPAPSSSPMRAALLLAGGALALALTLWALASAYKSRNGGALALALFAAFVVLSAAAVAQGRFSSGPEHAESSRYLTYSGALYAALTAICLLNWRVKNAAGAALALLLLVYACAGGKDAAAAYQAQFAHARARTTLVTGARDRHALEQVMFSAMGARIRATFLRDDRRGFFSNSWTHKMGERLDLHALPNCGERRMSLQFIPGRGSWYVRGVMTDDAVAGAAPRRLAFADASGRMVGYAEFLRRPFPLFRHAFGDGDDLRWAGHVLGDDPFPLTPVAVINDRPLCRLSPITGPRR